MRQQSPELHVIRRQPCTQEAASIHHTVAVPQDLACACVHLDNSPRQSGQITPIIMLSSRPASEAPMAPAPNTAWRTRGCGAGDT